VGRAVVGHVPQGPKSECKWVGLESDRFRATTHLLSA